VGIGTGVGGSRIVNGQIDHNTFGFEPGHHIVNLDSTQDSWEELVSGSAIKIKYGKSLSQIDNPQEMEQIHSDLIAGLYNLTLFWSPEVIVLGGGIGNAGLLDIYKLNAKLSELNTTRHRLVDTPSIVQAQLGDNGGLIGALIYLAQKH
jgi:predicted NBD/HSP70 family sugar kinase